MVGFPFFPESGGFLESLDSLESLEMDFSEKTPFPKDPFFRTRKGTNFYELLEMKNLGHTENNTFNKHFQGANSELNSLYFPRKTPWI